jgi:hypothetical protein
MSKPTTAATSIGGKGVKKDTTTGKQDSTKTIRDTTPVPPVPNYIGDSPNIYLAGFVTQSALSWKNGVADTLNKNAAALAMCVDGADTYVAGNTWIKNIPVATYWKNGIRVLLSDTSTSSFTNSVIVSQNSVYVIGYEMGPHYGGPIVAKYWKDGVPFVLSAPGATGSVAVSACISGSDLYIAGWVWLPNSRSIATYWKNGTPVYLTDGSTPSSATSIFVYGDDVYVAGTVNFSITDAFPVGEVQAIGKLGTATYWRNGKPVTLSASGRATSILVSGSDIYVAGSVYSPVIDPAFGTIYDGDIAVYWKNGVVVKLNDKSYSLANSISVTHNGDVYLAGHINNLPVYWKNGEPTYIPIKYNGYLNSIVLTN